LTGDRAGTQATAIPKASSPSPQPTLMRPFRSLTLAIVLSAVSPTATASAQPTCVSGALPASNLLALGGCRLGPLVVAVGGNTGHGSAGNVEAIHVTPLFDQATPLPVGLRFSVLDHPLLASVTEADAPFASDFLEVSMWIGAADPLAGVGSTHLSAPVHSMSGFPAGQAQLDALLMSMPPAGNWNYEHYSVVADGALTSATHECRLSDSEFRRPCSAPAFSFTPEVELRLTVSVKAMWNPSTSASLNGFGGPGAGPMSVAVSSVDVLFAATSSATTTPEPSTLLLVTPLVAGGALVARRRRRSIG
jgi:hypothetical protein